MLFDLLYNLVSPILQDYRADLEKWDRQAIADNPGCPFLHWTRASGTHIQFLPTADSYPAEGVLVPYLFGSADRHHLLQETSSMAGYHANKCNGDVLLVLYYDGCKIRTITLERAVQIAREYRRKIEYEWAHPACYA